MSEPPVIAICNSSSDVRALLKQALEEAGFRTVFGHVPEIKAGQHDFVAFIEEHQPRVIVYDVGPPYEENWTFLQLVRNTQVTRGIPFVLTTTNKRALDDLVGQTPTTELLGKQDDLGTIVQAVQSALVAEPEPA